jgi:hypothetical protein
MIQVNFPNCQTTVFVIYAIGVFSRNLNGYILAMGELTRPKKSLQI